MHEHGTNKERQRISNVSCMKLYALEISQLQTNDVASTSTLFIQQVLFGDFRSYQSSYGSTESVIKIFILPGFFQSIERIPSKILRILSLKYPHDIVFPSHLAISLISHHANFLSPLLAIDRSGLSILC